MSIGRTYTLIAIILIVPALTLEINALFAPHLPKRDSGFDAMGHILFYLYTLFISAPALYAFSRDRSGSIVQLDAKETVIIHDSVDGQPVVEKKSQIEFLLTIFLLLGYVLASFYINQIHIFGGLSALCVVLLVLAFIFYESLRVGVLRSIARAICNCTLLLFLFVVLDMIRRYFE